MTRVELAAKLQNHLNNSVYYTSQNLNDSIQDGLDECVALSGCRLGTALVQFRQLQTYYDMLSLVPDYIGVISIFNQVTKRWLTPTSLRKLEASRRDWDCAIGTPECFAPISFRYIAISRKPNVANYGNMLIYYRAAAPELSDTSLLPIPFEHIQALETYCLTDLAEQAQEWGKAGLSFRSYQKSLEFLRVAIQNQINQDRQMGLK